MDVLGLPYFFFTYALLQAVVFLLLIRFLDLYEREPLGVLALMFAWGATGPSRGILREHRITHLEGS